MIINELCLQDGKNRYWIEYAIGAGKINIERNIYIQGGKIDKWIFNYAFGARKMSIE